METLLLSSSSKISGLGFGHPLMGETSPRICARCQRSSEFVCPLTGALWCGCVQIFGLMNLIIDRLGDSVKPFAEGLMRLLPGVWRDAEGQSLLRIQVQCFLSPSPNSPYLPLSTHPTTLESPFPLPQPPTSADSIQHQWRRRHMDYNFTKDDTTAQQAIFPLPEICWPFRPRLHTANT